MHIATLVIGDVEAAMKRAQLARPEIDWWGLGGRYTGRLTAKPGASSTKVWGDTVPDFEASLNRMLSQYGRVRRSVWPSTGVDQLRLADLDLEATGGHGCPCDLFGMVIGADFIVEPDEDTTALSVLRSLNALDPAKLTDEELEARADLFHPVQDGFEKWHAAVAKVMDSLSVDTLLTVVDVHL